MCKNDSLNSEIAPARRWNTSMRTLATSKLVRFFTFFLFKNGSYSCKFCTSYKTCSCAALKRWDVFSQVPVKEPAGFAPTWGGPKTPPKSGKNPVFGGVFVHA